MSIRRKEVEILSWQEVRNEMKKSIIVSVSDLQVLMISTTALIQGPIPILVTIPL